MHYYLFFIYLLFVGWFFYFCCFTFLLLHPMWFFGVYALSKKEIINVCGSPSFYCIFALLGPPLHLHLLQLSKYKGLKNQQMIATYLSQLYLSCFVIFLIPLRKHILKRGIVNMVNEGNILFLTDLPNIMYERFPSSNIP